MDLEAYQREIGGISRYQIVIICLASTLMLFSSLTSQAAVFLSAVPDHRCSVPPIDDPNSYNFTESEILNLTIPYNPIEQTYDECQRYAYNLSTCTGGNDVACITSPMEVGVMTCDKGYHYDTSVYKATTISDFNLVCDRVYLDTLANTLFFAGIFIGSAIVGPLSDWFGRKVAVIVFCLGLVSTGVGCAFAPTYEIFVVTRVLTAIFGIPCFIIQFTYVTEISGIEWRTQAGLLVNMGSALSHAILPGVAYALRDWRGIQLFVGASPAIFLLFVYFIPESPRWLLTNKKYNQAKAVIGRFAKSKGKVLSDETWDRIVEMEEKHIESRKSEEKAAKKLGIWDLFRFPAMRVICVDVLFIWFTISMVFYGLTLNGGSLAGDPYLNTTLNGLVEVGAYLVLYFSGTFGRKPMLSGSFILGGLSCISSMLCDYFSNGDNNLLNASTALAIIGKFFASLGFALVYQVTSELFPTEARTTAVSMGSMSARVGSMLSPLTLQLQKSVPWATQTIFGTLSVLAGFTTLFFPETNKAEYLRSLPDAEQFYWDNIFCLKWWSKGKKSSNEEHTNCAYVDEEKSENVTRL
ncbi:solute carrier family 22 member 13-like [Ciona intestinalis]